MHYLFTEQPRLGLRLLDVSADRSRNRTRNLRRERVPELRIVRREEGQQLFQYATAAKSSSGSWETIVFAALAIAAAGALVTAFL